MHNNCFLCLVFTLFIVTSCSQRTLENLAAINPDINENETVFISAENRKLFYLLKEKDSLLFQHGFNTCDTTLVRKLTSGDFEFYHDQSGIVDSKETFIFGIAALSQMNYRATRVLVPGSLKVFPLFNNGRLYGAIQNGEHLFYGQEKGQSKHLTSRAKFTHVWILENQDWKLKRVLSFDHREPEK